MVINIGGRMCRHPTPSCCPYAGILYGTERYLSSGVGLGREATNWLTERGVRLVGTDAWSWQGPTIHYDNSLFTPPHLSRLNSSVLIVHNQ